MWTWVTTEGSGIHRHISTQTRSSSISSIEVLLLELTVNFFWKFKEAHKWKTAKYQELVEVCRGNTFRCAADDSVGQSVHHTHGLLGTREKENHQNITEVAERQLQVKRGEPWCSMVLGHKLGSDHPWLSQPGEGSDNQRPRTPDDPAFSLFTDDVSKLPVRADGVS